MTFGAGVHGAQRMTLAGSHFSFTATNRSNFPHVQHLLTFTQTNDCIPVGNSTVKDGLLFSYSRMIGRLGLV